LNCVRGIVQLLSPKQTTPLNIWMMSTKVLRVFSKLNSHGNKKSLRPLLQSRSKVYDHVPKSWIFATSSENIIFSSSHCFLCQKELTRLH